MQCSIRTRNSIISPQSRLLYTGMSRAICPHQPFHPSSNNMQFWFLGRSLWHHTLWLTITPFHFQLARHQTPHCLLCNVQPDGIRCHAFHGKGMSVWGYLGLRTFFPFVATCGEVDTDSIVLNGERLKYNEFIIKARALSVCNTGLRTGDTDCGCRPTRAASKRSGLPRKLRKKSYKKHVHQARSFACASSGQQAKTPASGGRAPLSD